MKSVTEFPNFKLAEGIKLKTELTAEGKTPDEIAAAMGEKFKFEGDKLKYFINAVEIASQATEKLFCIKIARLDEGQNPPPHGTMVEELCYIAEPLVAAVKKVEVKGKEGGRGGNRGGRQGGKGGGKPKESPWGISPEEKAAKQAAARQSAREKSLAGKA